MWPAGSSATSPSTWFEYVAVIDCPGNSPQEPDRVYCIPADTFCELNFPDSSGPYSRVNRREADATGPLSEWTEIGTTCYYDLVPARSGEGGLTQAMIIEQFYSMQFAEPTIVMAPPDNQTLVTLPVYFEVTWPEEGFEPAEVDETTLAARQVRIRPVLQDVVYTFGDGSSMGPTTSLGGPYPAGDVTHAYADPAEVTASASVTYSGEVSVDGGPWQAIDASVTLDGPGEPLTVRTSRNRLYDD